MRAALALLLIPALATAQFPADLQPGTRVRVSLPEHYLQMNGPWHRQQLRGTVETAAGDTLRLTVPGAIGALAIPRASIRRLEVSRGRPNPLASAFERAMAGAVLGAVGSVLTNNVQRWAGGTPNYSSDWRAAGNGAMWGAGAGAIVGLLLPNERWRRLRLSR